jgi:hypothetical protein
MRTVPLAFLALACAAFPACGASDDGSTASESPAADAGTSPARDASTPARDASDAGSAPTTPDGATPAPSDDARAPAQDAGAAADAADTPDAADASNAGGPASFTVVGRDEDRGSAPFTKGSRARFDWDFPGATKVSLTGAGDMIALETTGAPAFDDMGGANASAANAIASAQVPFAVNLLGDSWPLNARISISPKGVIARGLQTASSIVDPVLPIPKRTISADWADGTIAAYLDPRFEGRDSTAKILTKSFDAGQPNERFVVEWSNFTTGVDFKPRLAVSMRVQAVIFANGAFEFRYGALANPATATPRADGAFLRGQGASIGLASSSGATALVSQHVETLDASGTTFRFLRTTNLPPRGRGIFLVPATSLAALPLTLTGSNGVSKTASLAVADAYAAPITTTAPFASIRNEAGVRALAFASDNALPLEVPFALQVFGERWQSLAVFRTATVGPWGASVLGMTGGTNYDSAPFPKPVAPNGFVAGLYAANGSSWCSGGAVPTAYALVRESATPKSVTIEWPGLHKCGSQALGSVDVQVTLRADGTAIVHHGATSAPTATVSDQTLFFGLENGAGTQARFLSSTSTALTANRVFTFTRP